MEKNQNTNSTLIVIAFIIAGGLIRLLLAIPDKTPNISPVWAIMLFAGVYLKDKRLAFIIPLATMFITDLTLQLGYLAGWRTYSGFYSALPFVYLGFLLNVLVGIFFRNNVKPLPLAGAGLLATTVFFIVSNFGVWVMGGYPQTVEGFVECYYRALPFYGYSIVSTMLFIPVFFGGYEYVKQRYFASSAAREMFKGQDSQNALTRKKVDL